MVVVGGAWIYLQDTTLPAVNDGAINIYIHFVAPSAGFISVVLATVLDSYLYSIDGKCQSRV